MTAIEQYRPNTVTEWHDLTNEQVDLIKRTIAKDASTDELALFVAQANKKRLDPFSNQIWFTKRQGKVSILTGIDGYRLIADRTGMHAGTDSWWCGDDGIWKDVWLSKDRPSAAKVTVRKLLPNGAFAPYTGIALWSEYGANADGFMFKKMPAAQLRKCAEALALRQAFPAETSGVYTSEEMEQADRPALPSYTREPVDVATGEIVRPVTETREVRSEDISAVAHTALARETRRREPPAQPGHLVASGAAKQQLIDAGLIRGIGKTEAVRIAIELWGERGKASISVGELAGLVDTLGPVELAAEAHFDE